MIVLVTAAVVMAEFVAAGAFYWPLGRGRAVRSTALLVLGVPILLAPLLVQADHRPERCLAAIVAVALMVKLVDLHIGAGRGHRPDARTFAAFLPSPFSIVLRKLADEPRPRPGEDVARLASALLGATAGMVLLVAAFRMDWSRLPFVLEHAAKVVALFLMLVPVAHAGASAWRLLGGEAREFMDNPFAARTPADFWRRYNRPAQQFLHEDVFKPTGGLRRPVRATIATFAVSAIVHEYVFGIPIGRVEGYQTAFFMIQGCAAAATMRVRPQGWRAVPWVIATFSFNLLSSWLFFKSVDGVVPFYARRSP